MPVVMGWRAFQHGHLLRKADSSKRDMQAMPLIDQWSAASRSKGQHQEHRHRRRRVGIRATIRVPTALGCAPSACARNLRPDMPMPHAADRWQPSLASHAAQAGQVIALRACAHRSKRCTMRARPGMWHRLLSLSFAHCGKPTRHGTPPCRRQHS
ncbi:hypothetical protein, partial [Xanthomonas citri]|uniref:hypothetical protein n=2 Tax=Xanthomonas citri TaxID=346 RepID=UPI001F3BD1E0